MTKRGKKFNSGPVLPAKNITPIINPGQGIFSQITNTSNYNNLTAAKLKSIIRQVSGYKPPQTNLAKFSKNRNWTKRRLMGIVAQTRTLSTDKNYGYDSLSVKEKVILKEITLKLQELLAKYSQEYQILKHEFLKNNK